MTSENVRMKNYNSSIFLLNIIAMLFQEDKCYFRINHITYFDYLKIGFVVLFVFQMYTKMVSQPVRNGIERFGISELIFCTKSEFFQHKAKSKTVFTFYNQ